ncbi:MAG: nuclear transport factor 2 family protein [Ferruginibacter sp.]
MNNDERLIERFFTAFQKLDADEMNACYSDDIAFYDPMFELLRGDEARAMWEMLCKNAKNFSLTFDNIKSLDDGYYTCNWTATYTFSKTGRPVVNMCKAHMRVENGLVIEHSDGWSLQKWSAQAIGISGKLFGWAGFYRRRLKNNARRNLLAYLENRAA